MEPGPILICYDGSPGSNRAVDAAAELFGSRHAVVLSVGPLTTAAESMASIASVVPGDAFEQLNESEANDRAELGAQRARTAGLDAEPRSTLDSPTWEGIVDVAEDIGAAVIVIGSRGLRGLKELAQGSVSHDVATHAKRPVLIVPPPAA